MFTRGLWLLQVNIKLYNVSNKSSIMQTNNLPLTGATGPGEALIFEDDDLIMTLVTDGGAVVDLVMWI